MCPGLIHEDARMARHMVAQDGPRLPAGLEGHLEGVGHDGGLGGDARGALQLLHEAHDVEHHLRRGHLVVLPSGEVQCSAVQ